MQGFLFGSSLLPDFFSIPFNGFFKPAFFLLLFFSGVVKFFGFG
jgi:hypothetical protein